MLVFLKQSEINFQNETNTKVAENVSVFVGFFVCLFFTVISLFCKECVHEFANVR